MAGFWMISLFWMSLMTCYNPAYSAWCHQYGPDSGLLTADFHRGDGLAVTNINDDQQNFGCVNDDCFPSDRDRYVIAQLASGNTNNSVRVVIKADGSLYPNCRRPYKLILISLNTVNWEVERIGDINQFNLSEVHVYDFDDDDESSVTGIGNIRPTRSPEEDSGADWEDDHMEYLKRFMEFHGLISTALSINVGESPTKWTLTVNGTCCSGLGTLPASTTSTSSWTNNPPSQDTFTTGAEDDSQVGKRKKPNTAIVVSLVVLSVVLIGVFIAVFCYCFLKKNKPSVSDHTTQPMPEHRHRQRNQNPDPHNHRQPVSDQRYVHNTRSPTPNDRVYYEEAAAVIPPQIPSRSNRP